MCAPSAIQLALQHRLARRGRQDDEVGAVDGVAHAGDGGNGCRDLAMHLLGERAPVGLARTPDPHIPQRAHVAERPRWLRACTPEPRIASTPASSRASRRAETADTAAVRASVM